MIKQSSGLRKIANSAAAAVTLRKIAEAPEWWKKGVDFVKDVADTPEGKRLGNAALGSVDAALAPTFGQAGQENHARNEKIRNALSNYRNNLSPENKELYDATKGILPVVFDKLPGAAQYRKDNDAANAELNRVMKKYLPKSYSAYTGGSSRPSMAPGYNFPLGEFFSKQTPDVRAQEARRQQLLRQMEILREQRKNIPPFVFSD